MSRPVTEIEPRLAWKNLSLQIHYSIPRDELNLINSSIIIFVWGGYKSYKIAHTLFEIGLYISIFPYLQQSRYINTFYSLKHIFWSYAQTNYCAIYLSRMNKDNTAVSKRHSKNREGRHSCCYRGVKVILIDIISNGPRKTFSPLPRKYAVV